MAAICDNENQALLYVQIKQIFSISQDAFVYKFLKTESN